MADLPIGAPTADGWLAQLIGRTIPQATELANSHGCQLHCQVLRPQGRKNQDWAGQQRVITARCDADGVWVTAADFLPPHTAQKT